MKYKVGDKVILRSDLIYGEVYGHYSYLSKKQRLKGKTVTIKEVREGYFPNYRIEECNYPYWTNEMFINPKEIKHINIDKRGVIQWILE